MIELASKGYSDHQNTTGFGIACENPIIKLGFEVELHL